MTSRKDAVDLAGETEELPPKPFPAMTDEQWAEHVKGLREAIANWDPETFVTLKEYMEGRGIVSENDVRQ